MSTLAYSEVLVDACSDEPSNNGYLNGGIIKLSTEINGIKLKTIENDEDANSTLLKKIDHSSSHETSASLRYPDCCFMKSNFTDETNNILNKYHKHLLLIQSDHIRALQTVIKNKNTTRNDFLFHADRLIRLVVEEGLNQLPYENISVTTPTGHVFNGVKFLRGNCGVSVMRSGEAMERGLRDCCRSMRIGKILIQTLGDGEQAKVFYAKLPPNIENRKVLLMYPILGTGTTVLKALDVLRTYNVSIENVILLTLFISPQAFLNVLSLNPGLRIVTTEVDSIVPSHFGQRYFGTS